MWTFDDALLIPQGEALKGWLYATGNPTLSPPRDPSGYMSFFDFVRVRSVRAFWDEQGRGSLSRSIAGLCGGLWRIQTRLVLTVQRDGPTLRMALGVGVGAAPASGRLGVAATPIVAAALPGAELEPENPQSFVNNLFRKNSALAVLGTPRTLSVPNERTLLEVLAESNCDNWTLTIEAEPVPFVDLAARLQQLDAAIGKAAEKTSLTRRLNSTDTQTIRDTEAEHLVALLTRERERADQSLRRGGFVVTSWLTADQPDQLIGLGGVIAGTLAPTRLEPRGLTLASAVSNGHAAGSFLVADELASMIAPPTHDVRGFRVVEWSRFDAEPETPEGNRHISLGTSVTGAQLKYPIDGLTAHALVTGITGSGKSSFLASLLSMVEENGKPYLVIEPTKDEYASRVAPENAWVVGSVESAARFQLNPFEVPDGIPVQTHLDVLVALFTSSFSLISPLPFVLELAIRAAYEKRGWDLATNLNLFREQNPNYPAFPSFSEVINAAEDVVKELGYQGEVLHNVRGALRARLGAMTVGMKGLAFDTDRSFDMRGLLSRPAVINLDLVGNDEEKAFIIGLVMVRLWEARRGKHARELRHVVVLEEAHRILRRDQKSSTEDRGGAAFASELFANLLAEVRSAGQGIVIVDQSPRKLSPDALANTALKVAFRTTYGVDKEELASALNLDEAQQRAMTGMKTHHAAVFWEGMDRPVEAKMNSKFFAPASNSGVTQRDRKNARFSSPAFDELTFSWLIARPAERKSAQDHAQTLLRKHGANMPDAAAVLLASAKSVIERLGQARRWPFKTRDLLISQVQAAKGNTDVVRDALLDGSAPLRACALVCPNGGCIARENSQQRRLAVRDSDRLAQDWVREPGPRLRSAVTAMTGIAGRGDIVPSVATTAKQCLAAHVLEDRVPDFDVEKVISELAIDNTAGERS